MKRYSIALVIFAIVLAGISWWLSEISAPKQASSTRADNAPDYYAEQLTLVHYDPAGNPHYRLHTPHMRYFENSNTTHIELPQMWQYSQDAPPWTLKGESAVVKGNQDTIFLPGRVIIDHLAGTATNPYHIITQDLSLNTETSYAETDHAIRIESGTHWITAIGMQGWLQKPIRIKLMNQVRGYYEIL